MVLDEEVCKIIEKSCLQIAQHNVEWATISEMHIMLGVLMELTLYFLVFILIYFSLKISKLRLTSGKERLPWWC